jgi:hypothetical protein
MMRIAIIEDSPTGIAVPVTGRPERRCNRRARVADIVCRESPPLAWMHHVNTLQGAG